MPQNANHGVALPLTPNGVQEASEGQERVPPHTAVVSPMGITNNSNH